MDPGTAELRATIEELVVALVAFSIAKEWRIGGFTYNILRLGLKSKYYLFFPSMIYLQKYRNIFSCEILKRVNKPQSTNVIYIHT